METKATEFTTGGTTKKPLSADGLRKTDAYWRAANYLSVGQIYLSDNPLLREPLCAGHIKPRLLGHWGTTPGLNFLYVHMNRVIKKYDLNAIFITGPGHGGPGLVANTYLEGTYSEIYPEISQDLEGMRRLFKQFSFPGGIPSHVLRKRRVPSTKAENSGTPSRTHMVRRWTTPICWCAALWAMEWQRPDRLPRVGTRTSSWTRPATGRFCRFFI
jgi:hypothetical protein